MKKYWCRISHRYGCKPIIKKVEAERETEKSIWVDNRRSLKRSAYGHYYDTFDEAKKALFACQKEYVRMLLNNLDDARNNLFDIMKMQE